MNNNIPATMSSTARSTSQTLREDAKASILPEDMLLQVRQTGFLRPSPFGAIFTQERLRGQLTASCHDPYNKWAMVKPNAWILETPFDAMSSEIPQNSVADAFLSLALAILSELSPADMVRFSQVSRRCKKLALSMPLKTFRARGFTGPFLGLWIIDTETNGSGIIGRIDGGAGPIAGMPVEDMQSSLNRKADKRHRYLIRMVVVLNPLLATIALPDQRAKAQAISQSIEIRLIDKVEPKARDSRDDMYLTMPPSCAVIKGMRTALDFGVKYYDIRAYWFNRPQRIALSGVIVPTEEEMAAARSCPCLSVEDLQSLLGDDGPLPSWLRQNSTT